MLKSCLLSRSLRFSSLISQVRNMSDHKFLPSKRIKDVKESIWNEFSRLARENKSVNLGQGFPDFEAPHFLIDAFQKIAQDPSPAIHQYTAANGHPRLVNALAKIYGQLLGHEINPTKEIIATIGAYESLYLCIMAYIDKNDEVVVIEPFFDSYVPVIVMAGGIPKFVPLRLSKNSSGSISSKDWKLNHEELEAAFSDKTKMIIINNPHNPIGKVFSVDELQMIANLAQKYNCIVVMDEVYEWIVYEGNKHIRMASLPNMWERTLTIGSAGKTFSVTGWKLGWTYGPQHLVKNLMLLNQNIIYSCPTPIQEAVAVGFEIQIPKLGKLECYWTELAHMLQSKRDKMVNILKSANVEPTIPDGGYFIMADISEVAKKVDYKSEIGTNDYQFVKWLSKNKKLQGIPPSVFYSDQNKFLASNYIRLCFFKKDETLDQSGKILSSFDK